MSRKTTRKQQNNNGRPGLFDKGFAYGSTQATEHRVGIVDPAVSAVLDDFYRFSKPEARAAFAGTWLKMVAGHLNRTWPVVYQLLALVKERELYKEQGTLKIGMCFNTFPEFFEKVIGQPFTTWAELEETYHFVKDHKPELFQASYGEAAGARQQAAMEKIKTTQAARPEEGGRPNNLDKNEKCLSLPTGSNTSARRIARLKRDHPEAAERLERGEFKSVRAAERWARGEEPHPAYPKKTGMMWLKHWWNKVDSDTRQEFLDWIGEQNGGEV